LDNAILDVRVLCYLYKQNGRLLLRYHLVFCNENVDNAKDYSTLNRMIPDTWEINKFLDTVSDLSVYYHDGALIPNSNGTKIHLNNNSFKLKDLFFIKLLL
jgi:hypothetical protein